VNMDVVDTLDGVAALREDWELLFAMTPEASGFESHAWISACAPRVQAAGHGLHVGVVRTGGRAVAIFPAQLSSRRGLSFIGMDVGNYGGPVFDPSHLEEATEAWLGALGSDRQIAAIDLAGLRARSPFSQLVRHGGSAGWGGPLAVRTNTCPEVDLTGGWTSLVGRHKSKQRSTWRRKHERLEKLGEVAFVESGEPEFITEAMPRIVELWSERWRGQRVRASFAGNADFHLDAAGALAAAERVQLSTLQLDGEIIAFAYGLRGSGFTSSYVLAHDERFHRYSPGLLLLLRVLESACERGDRLYDFSLGDAPYKAMWVTGEQDVHRVMLGRGRYRRAAWSAAWARARSVETLRALRLQGWRGALGREPAAALPDGPGLSAGETRTTFVYELPISGGGGGELRPVSYREMRELLSPRLLRLALERSFRGDDLLVVDKAGSPLGVVWRAAPSRRSELAGSAVNAAEHAVYYHPVAVAPATPERLVERLGAAATGLVVTNAPLPARFTVRGQVQPERATWDLEPTRA
jgi:CelD/BcsL family acetyltransferase involved in cellulose biosynthesis